jgi:hypothetical protein
MQASGPLRRLFDMSSSLRAIIALAFPILPLTSQAICSCECVDGVPRTICTQLEEAAADPSLCGLEPPLCDPVGEPLSAKRFDPPPGARDCREAALADASAKGDPTIVKVCDTVKKPTAP